MYSVTMLNLAAFQIEPLEKFLTSRLLLKTAGQDHRCISLSFPGPIGVTNMKRLYHKNRMVNTRLSETAGPKFENPGLRLFSRRSSVYSCRNIHVSMINNAW